MIFSGLNAILQALSVMLLMSGNPLLLVLILVLDTMLVSLILAYWGANIWYSYILILVFMSGMLVVFLYMTSLVPKEKYNMRVGFRLLFGLFLSLVVMEASMCLGLENNSVKENNDEFLSVLLSEQGSMVYFYLGAVLLLALLYSSSMCSMEEGSLQAK